MSLLAEALDRILSWLQKNYPPGAASLRPGLSLSEIEEGTKTLPFCLTQEVCELYQWAHSHKQEFLNHSATVFFGWGLCNLKQAKERIQDFIALSEVNYMGKPLFPIFILSQGLDDGRALAVVGDAEKKAASPVVYVSEIGEVYVKYTSLINMMLTLAEAYETGACYVDKSIYPEEGHIEDPPQNVASIYYKYSSGLLELALDKLQYALSQTSSQKAFMDFQGELYMMIENGANISLEQLSDTRAIDPLFEALQDGDEYVRQIARQALEQLNHLTA